MFTKLGWRTPARFVAGVVVCYSTAMSSSSAFSLSGTVFDSAARSVGLDPTLLYAVALAESAYSASPGKVAPSCLAIRGNKPYYPQTKQEAIGILDRILPLRKSVDIGCMQINWKWHGDRFDSPEQLLDPVTNINAAATILKDAINSVPNEQTALGIGRYHHWDVSTAEGYQRASDYGTRVLGILANLRALVGRQ